MQLFVQFSDVGVVERFQISDKSTGVVLEGVPTKEKPVVEGPPELADVIAWALGKVVEGRATLFRETLGKLGGVAPDKLDAVVAAIEAEKTK